MATGVLSVSSIVISRPLGATENKHYRMQSNSWILEHGWLNLLGLKQLQKLAKLRDGVLNTGSPTLRTLSTVKRMVGGLLAEALPPARRARVGPPRALARSGPAAKNYQSNGVLNLRIAGHHAFSQVQPFARR